jgi:hypothetical protein
MWLRGWLIKPYLSQPRARATVSVTRLLAADEAMAETLKLRVQMLPAAKHPKVVEGTIQPLVGCDSRPAVLGIRLNTECCNVTSGAKVPEMCRVMDRRVLGSSTSCQ